VLVFVGFVTAAVWLVEAFILGLEEGVAAACDVSVVTELSNPLVDIDVDVELAAIPTPIPATTLISFERFTSGGPTYKKR
jgi:hypothetical protein